MQEEKRVQKHKTKKKKVNAMRKKISQQTHNIFITFFKGRMNSLQKHFLVMFVKHYQNVLKCF